MDSLSLSHANLLQDLNRLPVSSDSRRVVNRRRELEEVRKSFAERKEKENLNTDRSFKVTLG